jgi:hypothetical protein
LSRRSCTSRNFCIYILFQELHQQVVLEEKYGTLILYAYPADKKLSPVLIQGRIAVLIDPLNTAALNTQPKNSPAGAGGKEQPQPQPTPAPAATGAGGSPVAASFSAAALLTARAVTAAGQTAEQNAVRKKEEKNQNDSKRHSPDRDAPPGSLLDTRV